MKFTSYATRIAGKTAYVYGGKALDFDWQGGLEEVLEKLIESGIRRIVLTLDDMKFLHYTLFAGLLATERRLRAVHGDLILAKVPRFVEQTLYDMDVLDRFAIVPAAETVERAEQVRLDLNGVEGISFIG